MNCLDESNPDTRPDEASGRPQTTRALSAAMAAIEAAAAMAQAAGGQMPDYTDTPGPGKRAARALGLPCGGAFESPEPDNLDRLERRPVEGAVFLCYLSYHDLIAMRTTGDVEDDPTPPQPLVEAPPNTLPALPRGFTWADPAPDGPSFRAPNGVVCCCASIAQAVAMARRWAVGR